MPISLSSLFICQLCLYLLLLGSLRAVFNYSHHPTPLGTVGPLWHFHLSFHHWLTWAFPNENIYQQKHNQTYRKPVSFIVLFTSHNIYISIKNNFYAILSIYIYTHTHKHKHTHTHTHIYIALVQSAKCLIYVLFNNSTHFYLWYIKCRVFGKGSLG